MNRGFIGVVVGFLFALFFVGIFLIPFVGVHINTGEGKHTGYITAVEKNGLIFKTWTAYVKTDVSSSQEDQYCVIEPSTVEALQKASASGERVTVSYFSWLAAGIANCGSEDAIISSVN